MKDLWFATLILLGTAVTQPVEARATGPGDYYVRAFAMNVRVGPDRGAKAVATLHRRQKVHVYEVLDKWARITEYYPTTGDEMVANWVASAYLATERPPHLAQPDLPLDPRIEGLPRYGEHGLSEDELRVLYAGAHHYLSNGRCERVLFGDKSYALKRTFYVNCGDDRHHFFTAKDIDL